MPLSNRPSLNLKQFSESSTQTRTFAEPHQADGELNHMGCTKRDVAHAVGLLEKIKADLSQLFPRQSNYIQRRTSTQVPRIPSRKSQVEKLPSIPNTYPVNLTAAPMPTEDLQPRRSVARHSSRISQSTLSAISQMWTAAVEEAEAEVVTERASVEVASQTMEQPPVVPENVLEPEAVPTSMISRNDLAERKGTSQLSMEAINESITSVVSDQEVVDSDQCSLKSTPSSVTEPSAEDVTDKCTSTSTLGMLSTMWSTLQETKCGSSSSNVSPTHLSLKEGDNNYPSTSTLGMLSTMWSTLQESESLSSSSEISEDNVEESKYPQSASSFNCLGEVWSELNTENASGDEAMIPEDEAVQTEKSVVRPPTPPVLPKRSHLVKEAVASQTSLRQIKEGTVSDFSSEFVSPLAIYSHAVVPYQSARTRFGLHSLKNDSHTQEAKEETIDSLQSSSKTEVAEENDPPMQTQEECHADGSDTSPVPPPCSPVSTGEQQEEVEQNVSEIRNNNYTVWLGTHKSTKFLL